LKPKLFSVVAPRWGAQAVPRVSGVGLTSGRAQQAMVDALRTFGIRHEAVLSAMQDVPRHSFIEPGLVSRAYDDVALPIGFEQTISKPSTVARMIELGVSGPSIATANKSDQPKALKAYKVLEVGTGCGYQAAVLAKLFGEVYSIERIRGLHELARDNLRALRVSHLRLVFGDGLLGVPEGAPYDLIIVAAAGLTLPDELLLQMAVGGRLVAPVAELDGRQSLHLVERTAQQDWQSTRLDSARFVPLRSGTR
jgi:protein-L-isoaspartate(D-aspartate) O-methyltransferase